MGKNPRFPTPWEVIEDVDNPSGPAVIIDADGVKVCTMMDDGFDLVKAAIIVVRVNEEENHETLPS